MSGFVARLDEINALADAAPGFVWRLQSDAGDSTAIRVFDDPLLIINMSVWQSLDALKQYVYRSDHVELIRDRDGWFHKMAAAHLALWWIPKGHVPSVEEGKRKLKTLAENGPTQEAFTFANPFLTIRSETAGSCSGS